MSFAYDYGLEYINKHDMSAADLRMFLVMTGSTCATERTAQFLSSFTSKEEYDGTSYARKDLASVAESLDTTSHFSKISATSPVWTTLGAGSFSCIGMVLFVQVTNDSDSVPIAYFDDSPTFPFNGIGDDVTLTIGATGLFRLQN